MLTFVFGHARVPKATHHGVAAQQLEEDAGAAAMQPGHEDEAVLAGVAVAPGDGMVREQRRGIGPDGDVGGVVVSHLMRARDDATDVVGLGDQTEPDVSTQRYHTDIPPGECQAA
jgi:hypothetical protein